MRGITDRNILDDFCVRFCAIVDKYCKYIIVSGFVVISSGRSRATEDIDMILQKVPLPLYEEIHKDLIKHGFVCMQSDKAEEVYDYLEQGASVRYTDKDEPLPEMEIKFAKDELDMIQLGSRVKLPLTGLDVWFSSINMNIAFKEELLKSEKDMKDAEHLRIVYPELVNEDEIKQLKKLIRRLRL